MTQVASNGLAPIHYTYDNRGRLATVTQGDRTETYAYNALGRLSSVTDALSRVTSFTYDAAGRLVSQSLPGGRTVAFTYDAAGNLTSLTPPGQPAHTFAYNAGNLATTAQAPAVAGSTGTTTFSYSREKELLALTRADSAVISLGYDAAGRANRVTSPDGVHAVTYHPATGQVTGLSAPGGVAQSFTYNGALPTATTWDGPVVRGTVGVAYDDALRPFELSVGGQSLGNIFYSPDGLPTNIGYLSLGYRADNALLESVSGGAASTVFAYDSLGQVLRSATVSDVSGDTLLRQAFTYDRLGRLTGLAERVQTDTVTYAYGYDAAGRLATVQTGPVVTAAYTYDLNGNRTRVVTPSQTVNAAYDAQDRLLSAAAATYTHAATGERTLKIVGTDTTRTRYDAFGNLRDVYLPNGTHVQYVVDAQQRRTARLVNGVVTNRWLYQSQLAIAAEVDGAGTPIRTFTYGAHGNVPELMFANGTVYRLVTDHLGSVRLVIDAAADTVVQRLAYDAYGRVIVDTKPGFQPWGYAGGLYDPLTGLVRFGARDYDAESGRWTAQDPAGFGGGSNTYEYGASQPHHAVDPDGEQVRIVGHLAASPLGYLTSPDSWHLALLLEPDANCPCETGGVQTVGGQRNRLGLLVTSENYPGDLLGTAIAVVPTPMGMSDCQFIRAIIAAARRHRYARYSVPNDFWGSMTSEEYNSNSFVSSVIRAAGGTAPILITEGFQVPGYLNPLPIPRRR